MMIFHLENAMSIRKIGDKKWQIDYYPQGRKGKRARIVFRGTEAEARENEAELRKQHDVTLSPNPKIIDIIPDYLRWLKLHRAPATYKDAQNAIKNLIHIFGKIQFSRITQTLIEQYKEHRQGRARATNKELVYLQGIISYAVKHGHANPLPFKIEKLPYRRPVPQIPTPDEVTKFLTEIRDNMKKALILLMWECGLRWKEASHIRVGKYRLGIKDNISHRYKGRTA